MYSLVKPEIEKSGVDSLNIKLYDLTENLYSNVYHSIKFGQFRLKNERFRNKMRFFDLRCYFTSEPCSFYNQKKETEEYDLNKLIELVEKNYVIFTNYVLKFVDGDIKNYKDKFWSDSGFLITILPIEENLKLKTSQKSELRIKISNIDQTSSGRFIYTTDGDLRKMNGLPKKYNVIGVRDFISIIRKNYIVVANRFLSQDFNKSIDWGGAYKSGGWKPTELAMRGDFWENKTKFTQVIPA
jgi:hypothetical protein